MTSSYQTRTQPITFTSSPNTAWILPAVPQVHHSSEESEVVFGMAQAGLTVSRTSVGKGRTGRSSASHYREGRITALGPVDSTTTVREATPAPGLKAIGEKQVKDGPSGAEGQGDIVSEASVNCGWLENHHLLEQGFNSSQGQVRDHSEGME
ncbi:unnamed protein product [Leuciscus chuanchicus]